MNIIGIDHLVTLIAAAPAPAHWFQPVMDKPEPAPQWEGVEHLPGGGGRIVTRQRTDEPFNKKERDEWAAERIKQAHIQWPLFWAKQQIALIHAEMKINPELGTIPYPAKFDFEPTHWQPITPPKA